LSAPDVEYVDWILFCTELLNVLRQIRDQLQNIGDRLAEIEQPNAGKGEP
jgi:hypothetical protein